jgi:hypothetical protein
MPFENPLCQTHFPNTLTSAFQKKKLPPFFRPSPKFIWPVVFSKSCRHKKNKAHELLKSNAEFFALPQQLANQKITSTNATSIKHQDANAVKSIAHISTQILSSKNFTTTS